MYSADFIERCKKAFPDYPHLHEMLDKHSSLVGELLYNCTASKEIPLFEIIEATELENLQTKAKKYFEQISLFNEWMRTYRNIDGC